MRTPIQIVVIPSNSSEYQLQNGHDNVYVLCDDGTIWFETRDAQHNPIWAQKPPIPQDNGDNHESSH